MSPLGRQVWLSPHLGARASDLLAGRLAAAEEAQVRAHLAACRDCAEHVRAHRSLRSALRRLDVPGAPPGLVAGLLAVPAGPAPGGCAPAVRPVRPARPAPRARFGTAVVGTMALASAGALGIGAVAGLDADVRPGSAVVTGQPVEAQPVGAGPVGAGPVGAGPLGAGPVGAPSVLGGAGLNPGARTGVVAGTATPSVVVAPAAFGTP